MARGDAAPGSEVDLLVTFDPGRSLFDQVHLIDDLGALLGTSVDVVAEGGLLDRDAHIVAEAVPLRPAAVTTAWPTSARRRPSWRPGSAPTTRSGR